MESILLALTTSFGYGVGDLLAGWLAPVLIVFYVQVVQSMLVLGALLTAAGLWNFYLKAA